MKRYSFLVAVVLLSLSPAVAQLSTEQDCNGNFALDVEELESGIEEDCNRDAQPDVCMLQPTEYVFEGTRRDGQEINPGIALGGGARILDVNGDGRMDVVAVYPGATEESLKRLKVYLADADGMLAESTDTELAEEVSPLFVLQGTNGLDLLIGSLYFQNDGSGAFSRFERSALDATIVGTVDFSGDGVDDLLVTYAQTPGGSNNLNMGIAVNSGDGNFSDIKYVSGTLESEFYFDTSDFNKDGFEDVVLATPGLGETELFLVLGGTEGNSSGSTLAFIYSVSAKGVKLGDVNEDGQVDIVLLSKDKAYTLTDFEVNGSNNGFPKLASRSACSNADLVDINGDGSLDLICDRVTIPTICCRDVYRSYVLNDGRGSFLFAGYELLYSTGRLTPNVPFDEVFKDVTNDGRPDRLSLFEQGTLLNRTLTLDITEQASSEAVFPEGLDENQDLQPDTCGTDGLTFRRYSQWNSYLNIINIAELKNYNRDSVSVRVNLRDSQGRIAESVELNLAAGQERDLILSEFPLLQNQGYGIVEIMSNAKISGGVSYYRSTSDESRFAAGFDTGDYDFAFHIPFSPPLYSPRSFLFNSYQPSALADDAANPVYNWLTIVNLGTEEKSFTIESQFDGAQEAVVRRTETAEFGRVDIDGGHGFTQGFNRGVHSVNPSDEQTPYLAMLSRYGTTFDQNRFSYAFPSFGAQQSSIVSTGGGAATWLEIANPQSVEIILSARFYDRGGAEITQVQLRLAPYENAHYLINNWIGQNTTAHLDLTLVSGLRDYYSQVVSYFYSASTGAIETAYLSVATPRSEELRFTSYNLYLGMFNWLRVLNETTTSMEVFGEAFPPEGRGLSNDFFSSNLSGRALVEFDLHNTERFGTSVDTFGVVDLSLPANSSTSADLLRVKPTTSGGFDFIMQIPLD